MKTILLFTGWLFLQMTGHSQPATKPRALLVGDTVPVTFRSQLSVPPKQLMILDFWATNCGSCIGKFGFLDSLQQHHRKEICVTLVNSLRSDTRRKIDQLFSRLRLPKTLRRIDQDSVFIRLFPHDYVPYSVWLDSNYVVVAINDGDDISTENITAMLAGKPVDVPVPEDQSQFNYHKPLWLDQNGGSGKEMLHRSTLSAKIAGLGARTQIDRDSTGLVTRMLLLNVPARELFSRGMDYFERPSLFEGAVLPSGTFTYELITPPISYDRARKLLRDDLERYFSLAAERKGPALFIHSIKTD